MSGDVPTEVRTERLLLRSSRAGDGPYLHDALKVSMDELYPWLSFAAELSDVETLEEISQLGGREFEEGESHVWRIWEPDQSLMIGTVYLSDIDLSVPKCELGYWMRSSHAGRGLCAEASRAALDVAWNVLGALRVEALCDPRNERSWRLLEHLGFELESTAVHNYRDASGALADDRIYSIIRPEGSG